MMQPTMTSAERERELTLQRIGHHRSYLARVIRARLDTRLASRLDVSDVVQEVQIEAFRRLDNFLQHQAVPLKQWLRSLACDQVVMASRRHLVAGKRSLLRELKPSHDSVRDPVARIAASTQTPSAVMGKKQEREELHAAIGRLSTEDQRIIRLQVFEQLSGREAGHLMGISADAARQRLCRAMVRLRDEMSQELTSESRSAVPNAWH